MGGEEYFQAMQFGPETWELAADYPEALNLLAAYGPDFNQICFRESS